MNEERVEKVAAILTREGRAETDVLVFDHPVEEGGAMTQTEVAPPARRARHAFVLTARAGLG